MKTIPFCRKPFKITIREKIIVRGCVEKINQENRGLFGFHNFNNCPNCEKIKEGFELWGENNYLQATLKELYNREEMVKNFTKDYTYPVFENGEPIYYKGFTNCLT